ncbi:MAG: hypothetical protein FWD63_09400, partial [Propionibacteriaceae bacterium]|nr:hypothetical protein [Propionibacteriaceae bacterium]
RAERRFGLATAHTIERVVASLLVSRERLSVDEAVRRTAEEPTPTQTWWPPRLCVECGVWAPWAGWSAPLPSTPS